MKNRLLTVALISLFSCSTIPENVTAVSSFEKDRYLGTWYEIARTDNRFERGMTNVTATYALNEDNTIRVTNRGYRTDKKEWKQANGTAKFVKTPDIAMLKVSFFGPFYGGYNVIALDKDYQHALVIGDSTDYLWILSRSTTIPEAVKADYLARAKAAGVNIEKLIWLTHENDTP